jgi:hypothetical protein
MGQPREEMTLRSETTNRKNVAHHAVVDKKKKFIPPPHIKLGLIKISVKGMDKKEKSMSF